MGRWSRPDDLTNSIGPIPVRQDRTGSSGTVRCGTSSTRTSPALTAWTAGTHRTSLLGVVEGSDVVELGCGTAHVAAWAARRGARCTAIDLSGLQLMTARRCQLRSGPWFPLIQADAEHVPLRDGCADLVVSEHGVGAWCEPQRWVPEAARLLRPGGRRVFMTNSILSALCVPEQSGPAGDRLLRAIHDVRTVDWPGGGIEHHLSHSEWIGVLRSAGFVIDELLELSPPTGSADPDWYEIVTAEWAGRWPAEDVWSVHLG